MIRIAEDTTYYIYHAQRTLDGELRLRACVPITVESHAVVSQIFRESSDAFKREYLYGKKIFTYYVGPNVGCIKDGEDTARVTTVTGYLPAKTIFEKWNRVKIQSAIVEYIAWANSSGCKPYPDHEAHFFTLKRCAEIALRLRNEVQTVVRETNISSESDSNVSGLHGNEERDRFMYNLALDPALTWSEIGKQAGEKFNETIDKKAAENAVKRYAKSRGLSVPPRSNRGRPKKRH